MHDYFGDGMSQRVCIECGRVVTQAIEKLPSVSTENQSGENSQIGTAQNSTSDEERNRAVKTDDSKSIFVWMFVASAAVLISAGGFGLRRKYNR